MRYLFLTMLTAVFLSSGCAVITTTADPQEPEEVQPAVPEPSAAELRRAELHDLAWLNLNWSANVLVVSTHQLTTEIIRADGVGGWQYRNSVNMWNRAVGNWLRAVEELRVQRVSRVNLRALLSIQSDLLELEERMSALEQVISEFGGTDEPIQEVLSVLREAVAQARQAIGLLNSCLVNVEHQ